MTDAIRTPEVLLDGLPGFPWAARFRQYDGLRLAHVDEGAGAPVLMLHGEPTWSFLWRKVAVPVLEAGHRAILPDLPASGARTSRSTRTGTRTTATSTRWRRCWRSWTCAA
jgi:haloalkane dehalogenase